MRPLLSLALLLSACVPPPAPQRAASDPAPVAKSCEPPQAMPAIPADAPKNSTYLSTSLPPAKYQTGPAVLSIEFVSPEEANRRCAAQPSGLPVCGRVFYACVQNGKAIMPNPCTTHGESYADLLCHETAHRRGWPAAHGD